MIYRSDLSIGIIENVENFQNNQINNVNPINNTQYNIDEKYEYNNNQFNIDNRLRDNMSGDTENEIGSKEAD